MDRLLRKNIDRIIEQTLEDVDYDTDGKIYGSVSDEFEHRGNTVYVSGEINGSWHWEIGGEPDELLKVITEYDVNITVSEQDNELILGEFNIIESC